MNKYCIHLKKRKNKPYCNIIKKEILFSRCLECNNKEYRFPVKGKIVKPKIIENSSYKKSDIMISNSNQIKKNAQLQEKTYPKKAKMHNKSKKLAKLERNRFSVFTDDDRCFVCDSTYQLTWHEIYAGRNRRNSMIYGFCLRMCLTCHEEKQEDIKFNDYWHRQAQLYWEENIGTRDEFLSVFRRIYLK